MASTKVTPFKHAFDTGKSDKGMGWQEALTLFERSRRVGNYGAKKPNRERTIEQYHFEIGDRFIPYMEKRGLTHYNELTNAHILAYMEWVNKKPWAPATRHKNLRALRTFFKWVGIDPECKLAKMKSFADALPSMPEGKGRTWIPTVEVMMQFLNSWNTAVRWGLRDYVIHSLMLDCGPRIGEICHMRLSHLKLEGNPAQIIIPEEGKTGSRIVPVSDAFVPAMRRWLRDRERYAKNDYVFVNRFGGRITPNTIQQTFNKQRQLTGLGKGDGGQLSCHVVRHYFCTHYLVNGGTLHNLKQITGHKTLETLMIYVHMANQLTSVSQEHTRVSPLKSIGSVGANGVMKKKRRVV